MIQFLRRHGFIYDQLPAMLWATIIFIASSIPNITVPKFVLSDKIIHLGIYLILCGLIYRALKYQNRFPVLSQWSLFVCVWLSIAYGATDEFHQSFVPNRDSSIYDLLADSIGATLFVCIVWLRQRFKGRPTV